jgi:glycosyltransferase involved in cell wall biosynthesis
MKILFINSLYAPNVVGGAERVVQSLAEGVAREGHQAVVVSVAPQGGTRTDWVNGVKAYYVGLKNVYWPFGEGPFHPASKAAYHALDTCNPWMVRAVARIVDEERPDLVHTNRLAGFSSLALQLVNKRGLPLVHTLHDYYLLCPRSCMFRNGKICRRRCMECRAYSLPKSRLSNRVDTVVGVSQYILERHLEFGYFAATPKRRVINNGYNIDSVAPRPDTWALPIRFGYIGRLAVEKGPEVLLRSISRLPARTWSLDVAGMDQTAYGRYLRTNYDTPPIEFLGHVEPEAYFTKIDVLVVPSLWYEPLGLVIIEAYAHGVPVVASNRGGIPELVEEGRTGFLFDPDCPGDLATKMQRFVDEPSLIRDMRLACLEKAQDFRPERVIEEYLAVYNDATKLV